MTLLATAADTSQCKPGLARSIRIFRIFHCPAGRGANATRDPPGAILTEQAVPEEGAWSLVKIRVYPIIDFKFFDLTRAHHEPHHHRPFESTQYGTRS